MKSKMMKKTGLLLIALLLVISMNGFVSAVDTAIQIKTDYPFHNTVIRILDASSGAVADTVYAKTDIDGVVRATYSGSRSTIGLSIIILENGNVLESQTFEDTYSAGTIIEIDISHPKTVPKVEKQTIATNETDNNKTNETSTVALTTESEDAAGVTGNAVQSFGLDYSSYLYFGLGALILLGIIGYFVYQKMGSESSPAEPSVKPAASVVKASTAREATVQARPAVQRQRSFTPSAQASQPQSQEAPKTDFNPLQDRDVEEAEAKIREAQTELDRIKKIRQAERRAEQAQRDLDRLKRGEK